MKPKMTARQFEQLLHARGFDLSVGRRVRCSQCEAMVINGISCHETGCPNRVHECAGCNALIKSGKYCADCA